MRAEFENKTALVVGGSGGIGAAFARALGAAGAEVVVHGGSSAERLDASIAAVRAAGGRARGFLLRLESPRQAAELVERAGAPDILVCAFGPFPRGALAATTAEAWERAALLDLALPGALASACVGPMAERGYGRLLFFGGTSTDSVRGYTSTAAYSAAKAGIGVLVKSIALEYAGTGVSAVALCPGFVDTEYLSDRERTLLRRAAPGGGLLEPGEIARIGLALLVGESTNGAIVAADGGANLNLLREIRRGAAASFDKGGLDE
jgi:3-oxoacyl-[acyl-carrier protein] reductase